MKPNQILEQLTFEVIRWNYGASSAECAAERAKALAQLNNYYIGEFKKLIGPMPPLEEIVRYADHMRGRFDTKLELIEALDKWKGTSNE